MERIVLEIDSDVAAAWMKTSPEFRARIEKEIEWRIAQRVRESQRPEFDRLLNDVREEAAQNGLTEEILNDILNAES